MARTVALGNSVNPQGFANASAAVAQHSRTFRDAAASTGMFDAQQLALNSRTQDYIKLLQKQKASLGDIIKSHKVANAAYKEQLALRDMTVIQRGTNARGQGLYDLIIPREVHESARNYRSQIGFIREEIRSAAQQTINWGKNTQWAGRQLMVGFTMPVAAFGAATGVLAYQVDKQMTRIQKVYDTTADANSKNLYDQMAVEKELASVRETSMATARTAAEQYGASVTDTLEIQAELAAVGYKGAELQAYTTEVMKNATLGEIEHQTALQATISLQTVLGLSTQELANTWAYMNSVENASSLAMADFAEAIPIALGPIKAMGGDIQLLGEYLTAMKERGIEANQGANAIKAMMQRIYRPSKQVREEFQALTGLDLTEMIDKNRGNIEGFIKDLAAATEDLNRPEEIKALAGLFGTWQVTRLGAILDGVRNLNDETTQMNRVMQIGRQSAEEWGEVQEREIGRMQESLSGRFNRALQTLRIELAETGEIFLKYGTDVLEIITKIVTAFNNAPEGIKKWAVYGAIFTALAGPIIMLAGLFGNMIGQMAKWGVALTKPLGTMQLLTIEQKATAVTAEMAAQGYIKQITPLQKLTGEVNAYLMSLAEANRQQGIFAAPTFKNPMFQGGIRSAANATTGALPVGQVGGVYPSSVISQQALAAEIASASMADNSEKTRKSINGAAVGMAAFSAATAATLISSNKVVDTIAQVLMITTLLGPALSTAWRIVTSGQIAVGLSKASTAIAGMKGGFKGALTSAIGLVNPVGLAAAGIAAAAGSAYLLKRHIEAGSEAFEETYNNADKLGEIFDYSPVEDATYAIDKQGESYETMAGKISEIRNTYGTLIGEIRNAGSELEGINERQARLAGIIGAQVISTGGTVEQAREATKLALMAAENITEKEANKIILRFGLDFSENQELIDQFIWDAKNRINQAMSYNANDQDWKDILIPGHQGREMDEVEAIALQAGKNFSEAFATALQTGLPTEQLETEFRRVYDRMTERVATLRREAEENPTDTGIAQQLEMAVKVREEMLRGVAELHSLDADKFVESLSEGATWMEALRGAGVRLSETSRETTRAVIETGNHLARGGPVYEGIENYSHGISENTEKAADETDRMGRNAERAAMSMSKIKEALPLTDIASQFKTAYSDTLDEVADLASDNFESRMSASLDTFREAEQRRLEQLRNQQTREQEQLDRYWQNRMDRESDRWDDREEAISDAFDGRIEKIEETIKAEERAEEIRQRIFDAERARIERMADMANASIDFSVALNSGDLDEAARIRNDMAATQVGWSMDDQEKALDERASDRSGALQGRIDEIEEVREARMEAFEDEREAHFKHLEKMERQEKKHQEKMHRQRERELEREVDANIEAQEEIWESRREHFDKAIDALRDYIPTSERDLQRHIAEVRGKYREFSGAVEQIFGDSSEEVGRMLQANIVAARRRMANDAEWEVSGSKIAKQMIRGAFGMSPEQFQRWMVTGVYPKGAGGWRSPREIRAGTAEGRQDARLDATRGRRAPGVTYPGIQRHEGGLIDYTAGSRKGVARTAKSHASEVALRAQKGEYVIKRDAVNKYGVGTFDAFNNGEVGGGSRAIHKGDNPEMALGFSGVMMGVLAAAVKSTIKNSVNQGAMNAMSQSIGPMALGRAKAGEFGNQGIGFDPEQIRNANLIATMGKSMGMSARDIQIGIMTAITESMLRNVRGGDRDSAGLFQQRPSQGWGSYAQVTDPNYAIRKFFTALRGVGNRDEMSPWMAAQTVQRSAYADGSNYKKYWDEAKDIFGDMRGGTLSIKGYRNAGGRMIWEPGSEPVNNLTAAQLSIASKLLGTRYRVIQGSYQPATSYSGTTHTGGGVVDVSPYSTNAVRALQRAGFAAWYRGPGAPGKAAGYGAHIHAISLFDRTVDTAAGYQRQHYINKTGDGLGQAYYGPHAPLLPGLARMLPQMKMGGRIKWDNTIANLHKDETVLTAPLSDKLDRGLDRFANGAGNVYNINMNFNGDVNDKPGMRRFILKTIEDHESRMPQTRRGDDR